MTIRVLRVIEYEYSDPEIMIDDMRRWTICSKPEWTSVRFSSSTVNVSVVSVEDEGVFYESTVANLCPGPLDPNDQDIYNAEY